MAEDRKIAVCNECHVAKKEDEYYTVQYPTYTYRKKRCKECTLRANKKKNAVKKAETKNSAKKPRRHICQRKTLIEKICTPDQIRELETYFEDPYMKKKESSEKTGLGYTDIISYYHNRYLKRKGEEKVDPNGSAE